MSEEGIYYTGVEPNTTPDASMVTMPAQEYHDLLRTVDRLRGIEAWVREHLEKQEQQIRDGYDDFGLLATEVYILKGYLGEDGE